ITSAQNVSSQIEQRLTDNFQDISKNLTASNNNLPTSATILRQDFLSSPAQAQWIAEQINTLITEQDISPSEIAVLAPKHKCLEPLITYLNKLSVPLRYEK